MGDLAANFGGWQPQAYGVWGLFVLVALYMFKGWLETRKLSSTDRQAHREGFARQVEILQTENRQLRADLRKLETTYDDYRQLSQHENSQLRSQLRSVEDHVTGLERKLAAYEDAAVRNLPAGTLSPAVARAARRAAKIRESK